MKFLSLILALALCVTPLGASAEQSPSFARSLADYLSRLAQLVSSQPLALDAEIPNKYFPGANRFLLSPVLQDREVTGLHADADGLGLVLDSSGVFHLMPEQPDTARWHNSVRPISDMLNASVSSSADGVSLSFTLNGSQLASNSYYRQLPYAFRSAFDLLLNAAVTLHCTREENGTRISLSVNGLHAENARSSYDATALYAQAWIMLPSQQGVPVSFCADVLCGDMHLQLNGADGKLSGLWTASSRDYDQYALSGSYDLNRSYASVLLDVTPTGENRSDPVQLRYQHTWGNTFTFSASIGSEDARYSISGTLAHQLISLVGNMDGSAWRFNLYRTLQGAVLHFSNNDLYADISLSSPGLRQYALHAVCGAYNTAGSGELTLALDTSMPNLAALTAELTIHNSNRIDPYTGIAAPLTHQASLTLDQRSPEGASLTLDYAQTLRITQANPETRTFAYTQNQLNRMHLAVQLNDQHLPVSADGTLHLAGGATQSQGSSSERVHYTAPDEDYTLTAADGSLTLTRTLTPIADALYPLDPELQDQTTPHEAFFLEWNDAGAICREMGETLFTLRMTEDSLTFTDSWDNALILTLSGDELIFTTSYDEVCCTLTLAENSAALTLTDDGALKLTLTLSPAGAAPDMTGSQPISWPAAWYTLWAMGRILMSY